MTEDQVKRKIDEFIKRTRRLLPDGFETDDILDDLKAHIHDSLTDKREEYPDADPILLLKEVLEEIGTPEDIAEEYRSEQVVSEEKPNLSEKWIRYVMRLTAAVLVAVLAAWIVASLGLVDFMSAVVILIAFAFIEWWVRGKQTATA